MITSQDLFNGFVPLDPDYQGWNYNSPVFQQLVQLVKPRTIIEVGSWKGMSAIAFHKSCTSLNLVTDIICVDTWLGSIEHMPGEAFANSCTRKHGLPTLYSQFLSNLHHSGCTTNIHTIPNTSICASRWLHKRGIKADLIYIDGSHEEHEAYQDIALYYSLLNQNGIMFGDDVGYSPVRSDYLKFCKHKSLKPEILYDNFWCIRN
jgi:hypothetical protein